MMNILNLLDILEDELENGTTVPLLGKIMIDRDKCLDIIRDIRLNLPEALKQAELIKKERQRILAEAQKEAETILKEAEQHIKALVDEHEITQMAYQQSREIIENAQDSAKKIRLGAREYADDLLQEVEHYLTEQLETIRQNREELNAAKR
jgi:vacuolar-type H+-ATPase subunit H